MKKHWKELTAAALFAVLLLFSKEAKLGAMQGLLLWSETLLPSLFPAFVAVGLLRSTGAAGIAAEKLEPSLRKALRIGGEEAVIVLSGLSGGYPLGAKCLCESVKAGKLTKKDADRLYRTCDNTGPAFAVGALGMGVFQSPLWGAVLWVIHALTALILTRVFSEEPESVLPSKAAEYASPPFGRCLSESVGSAVSSLLSIGGYVILFSALPFERLFGLLQLPGLAGALFRGTLELSSGIGAMIGAELSPLSLALAEFLLSFGGLCVHLQSLSLTEEAGLNGKERLKGKLLQGVLSSILAFLAGLAFL